MFVIFVFDVTLPINRHVQNPFLSASNIMFTAVEESELRSGRL
jgi:hypothetical protein